MPTQRMETAADLAGSAVGLTTAALARPVETWAASVTIGREVLASLTDGAASAAVKGDKRFRDRSGARTRQAGSSRAACRGPGSNWSPAAISSS